MTASTIANPLLSDSGAAGQELIEPDWQSTDATPSSDGFLTEGNSSKPTQRARSIRKIDVAEVTAQLAIMAKSGVDIASSLTSLAAQSQRPAIAEVLRDVCDTVLAGSSLSDALKLHPSVFEASFVATVAAGEASGRMAEVLGQLAKMQKNEIRQGREIRALLTYPVLLFLISGSVLSALVLFVLPQFTQIFEQYDMTLPVITQFLLATSDELRTRWWLWGPLAVSTLVGFFVWRKSEGGRLHLDRFWIQGPLVGEICCGMCIGATCRILGLMLENGVPLLESLRLTRQAIGNSLYKLLLRDLEEAVVNGQGLATVLRQSEIVPPSAKEMIITAENTGNLNEVTSILGDYYEEESEAKVRQLVGLLEPLITVGMGVIVAVVVLAVMLPVFNLSTLSSGGH